MSLLPCSCSFCGQLLPYYSSLEHTLSVSLQVSGLGYLAAGSQGGTCGMQRVLSSFFGVIDLFQSHSQVGMQRVSVSFPGWSHSQVGLIPRLVSFPGWRLGEQD